jgi:hypothetical protein
MLAFFILQLIGFFISIILLNHWINLLLTKRIFFDLKYLPCFGWGWFVYLVIYMIGRWVSAPVESVRIIYTAMALLIPALAGVSYLWNPHASVWQRRRKDLPLDRWTLLLVAAFIGGMIYVGPYLEFPSDPVEHLILIQGWEKIRWMNYAESDAYSSRFIYFFEHWLLQPSGLSFGNRTGLLFLSPLLQGILFWQFIRLTKILTNSTVLSWLGGLMSLGYFGYSAVSFYRYTVLAGALLAYTVFLEGLILIICTFSKEEWRHLFLLPPLLIFCWKNHPQEALLQLNGLIGICFTLLIFRYKLINPTFRKIMLLISMSTIIFSILVLFKKAILVENLSDPLITLINSYSLFGWNLHFPQFEHLSFMLGKLGWLAMLSAVAVLALLFNHSNRNLAIMAGLCIWPIFILWNPVSIEVLLRFIRTDVFSRLIYGSIYWIYLVVLIQAVYINIFSLEWFSSIQIQNVLFLKKLLIYITIIFLILLSWIPGYPVYGKMRQLWLKVEPRLDGSNLQQTIKYLRSHAPKNCVDPYPDLNHLPIRSYVLSDPYVNTYLLGTGYFYTFTDRTGSPIVDETLSVGISVSDNSAINYSTFLNTVKSYQICYVVLYLQKEELYSWVGSMLGHWRTDQAKTQGYYSKTFIEWITQHPKNFELVFEEETIRVFKVL